MKSIASRLINPSSRFDRLTSNIEEFLDPQQYLGYRYEKKIGDLLDNSKRSRQEEKCLRDICQRPFLSLHEQLLFYYYFTIPHTPHYMLILFIC